MPGSRQTATFGSSTAAKPRVQDLRMVVETCLSCSVQLKLGYSLSAPDALEFHLGVHGAGVVLSAQQHTPIINVDDAHGSVHVSSAAP